MKSYTLEEVAAEHLPSSWKDGARLLKRRLVAGEIPGKKLSRGVYIMTDEDIAKWLTTREGEQPHRVVPEPQVSLVEGLSQRSRRRLRSA